jgi:ribonucleoside-triphosphate reductase
MEIFKLEETFVNEYKSKKVNFGFNGLGELTYYRTYSRLKEDGTNEKWFETVERVVNGIYSIQKDHIFKNDLGWNENKAQKSAKEMYNRIFTFKFLPPGRGLWAAGTDIVKKGLGAALNNCGFTSTEGIDKDFTKPFTFMMDMSMLGVGIGFDVKGAGKITIYKPKLEQNTFIIPDTREGWVESLRLLLQSYTGTIKNNIDFDYSLIRKAGEPIKTFGGVSSGADPLIKLHKQLKEILDNRDGEFITETDIADIMNLIGVCVVSGNVRRSAQVMLGDISSKDYLDLKNYEVNPHRISFGWTSNNSVFCDNNTDYKEAAERTGINGEPGYFWLENAQKYGRIVDGVNWKDKKAVGANPCMEQTLENFELCCLVETFPHNHDSLEDYKRTLKFAYLYAKSVTLVKTHNKDTNKVLLKNRRIGLSQTGIVQFLENNNLETYRVWCDEGYKTVQQYDDIYSNWLCIPKSIKTTSIKPSGSISLLAGATPGMHYPESQYYIRRIRISELSPLVKTYKDAGYIVEEDVVSKGTIVIEIPVEVKCKTINDVSIWEQVALAVFIQKWWADNQVSCTVTFKPEEAKEIPAILNYYKYDLKAISFLPKTEQGAFAQMPYEAITKEKFEETNKNIKSLTIDTLNQDSSPELYCDSSSCEIK